MIFENQEVAIENGRESTLLTNFLFSIRLQFNIFYIIFIKKYNFYCFS